MRPCSDMIKTKTVGRTWGISSFMGQMEEGMLKKVMESSQENGEQSIWCYREAKEIVSEG